MRDGVSAGVLAKHPGSKIIHNLICSKAVPEVVRAKNGTLVRLSPGPAEIIDNVPAGRLYKDGNIVIAAGERALLVTPPSLLPLLRDGQEPLVPLLVVSQMVLETGNLTSFWSQPPRRNPAETPPLRTQTMPLPRETKAPTPALSATRAVTDSATAPGSRRRRR